MKLAVTVISALFVLSGVASQPLTSAASLAQRSSQNSEVVAINRDGKGVNGDDTNLFAASQSATKKAAVVVRKDDDDDDEFTAVESTTTDVKQVAISDDDSRPCNGGGAAIRQRTSGFKSRTRTSDDDDVERTVDRYGSAPGSWLR